ncbi:hypothetical protein [Polaribacter sp. HaHaR_3_91]|uniref:hypothetical protein n=1 Tax=Polaribacter sp. HaHaR_3_91 TaxID=2745561 RepID=UPI001C4EEFD9|nr:hypothetical protein [Polaribacter sp. HaHaR_3_91]QXP63319.1 hypothetical protein H0I27_16000 [Polaribacter sp. HaHaR_3_91]
MMKLLLTLLCIISFTFTNAQSNTDIANVYLKRAKEAVENNVNYKEALVHFEKALKYLDSISDKNLATLASSIYFENYQFQTTDIEKIAFLKNSEIYSRRYFVLEQDNTTEGYTKNLESLILIQETIEALETKLKREEEERIKKEKASKKIDSLKSIWNQKSESLFIKVDSIYNFNANNLALFKKDGSFGIIDDRGIIILAATDYKDAISSEGFILLKNKKEQPNKIYCFNTNNKKGFILPSVNRFNSLATHYGQVMLPRGNGRLVTYPDNSFEPLVYDLNVKKQVRITNKSELLKSLKKEDLIDRYNKDGEVKINKEWYLFEGHLGGGMYSLYFEDSYKVHSFLSATTKKILSADAGFEYIGAYYKGRFQAIKKGEVIWINEEGAKVSEVKDESKKYLGDSKVVKLASGTYQIVKNNVIVLGDQELEKLSVFLGKHKKN